MKLLSLALFAAALPMTVITTTPAGLQTWYSWLCST